MPRTLPRRAPVANGSYQPSSEEDEVEVSLSRPQTTTQGTTQGTILYSLSLPVSICRLPFLSFREHPRGEAARLTSTNLR